MSQKNQRHVFAKTRRHRAALRRQQVRQDHLANYSKACDDAAQGRYTEARRQFSSLAQASGDSFQAQLANDLAVLDAVEGSWDLAREGFERAMQLDTDCELTRDNLAVLGRALKAHEPEPTLASSAEDEVPEALEHAQPPEPAVPARPLCRVAILSFLFNWPSSGGGIVHTIELTDFLHRAGYDVRHIFCRHLNWGVGRLEAPLPYEPEVLEFDDASWNMPSIQMRFRQAVCAFQPDFVIITDSWNSKPLLAEAVWDYPYLLRLQASECLCPLNNLRLLPDGTSCPKHQLATPEACRDCLQRWGGHSGSLHQAERALCGVGTEAYGATLRRAFQDAYAVLVVEPLAQAMLGPHCRQVRVVPSGFDPARFPWPWPEEPARLSHKLTVLMAGVVEDPIKGFHVLHEACRRLWSKRQDFELMATGEPARRVDDFTFCVGWRSQEELPRFLRAADVVVLPAIAQEALGRTAVEAMAVGRPVIASRIGGLPHTLSEGAGLLFEPGSATDLASKLERLLDSAALRAQLGQAGRRRFEEHFTWDTIIERHYRPLLVPSASGQEDRR